MGKQCSFDGIWGTNGSEDTGNYVTSYPNRVQVAAVVKAVTQIRKDDVWAEKICVITPYEGQCAYVASHCSSIGFLTRDLYRDVELDSLDAFPGHEKKYITISSSRSNDDKEVGFLSVLSRFNLALTHSSLVKAIIGNSKALSRQQLWVDQFIKFTDKNVFVEGPLTKLKPCLFLISCSRRLQNGYF